MRAFTRVLLVGMVVVSTATVVSAQGGGPFNEILAKLDELLAVVSPARSMVTLSTSPLRVVSSDHALCNATNVSGTTLTVEIAQVDGSGETVFSLGDVLPPGTSTGFGAGSQPTTLMRCQFTFVGFADDVRANMTVSQDTETVDVVLEAR